ncbi:hypothetical protein [Streptomyces sp. ISL-94]|uniref:hypothetical protein n=1 Tax=Streptomyces sp. ISL-94 TaxID=2819190 RepID=UPI001BEB8684|nr:hypothetical protein [Streptomyces sp. ISL-94]MBT2481475.1 hypothetical protein [Streptomyces sp. ISL-94]
MTRFRRWYGASALHLVLLSASFALTGYAGVRLLKGDILGVALWFVGAAVLHDLVLLPLYSVADRAAQRLSPGSASVNHVRVPAFLSGLLLLVWWPLILRRVGHYTAATGLPADGFLGRWLLITAGLFTASAAVLLLRMWNASRPARRAARRQRRSTRNAR